MCGAWNLVSMEPPKAPGVNSAMPRFNLYNRSKFSCNLPDNPNSNDYTFFYMTHFKRITEKLDRFCNLMERTYIIHPLFFNPESAEFKTLYASADHAQLRENFITRSNWVRYCLGLPKVTEENSTSLLNENKNLKQEINIKNDEINTLARQTNKLKNKIQNIKQESTLLVNENEGFRQELAIKNKKIERLEEQKNQFTALMESAQRESKEQLDTLRTQFTRVQENYNQLNRDHEALKVKLENNNKECTKQSTSAQEKYNQLNQDHEAFKVKSENNDKTFKQEMASAQERYNLLEYAHNELKVINGNNELKLTRGQTELTNLTTKKNALLKQSQKNWWKGCVIGAAGMGVCAVGVYVGYKKLLEY